MTRSMGRFAAYALLGIMFARMLHAATLLSPVVDEQSHISRGLSVLRTGDLRLRIGHPIGLNVWEALPLALDSSVELPLSHESWANAAWDRFGEQFMWRVNANPDGIVFRSRVMVMLLTLVLGAIVFRWANEVYGPQAGLLALALYSLDPNILAHGMLATTDLGVTLLVFAAIYALWRGIHGNERRWHIAAGALTGLALISKYSALVLVPIFAVLLLTQVWQTASGRRMGHPAGAGEKALRSIGFVLRLSSFVLFPALLVILIVYLFRIDVYLGELGFLLAHTETHPSFLLGQRSIEGWWYYFLVTFAVKTPLPTLLLIGTSIVLTLRRHGWHDESFLIIPWLLHFALNLVGGFNVGYRHLLPAVPFLLVYASKITRIQARRLHPVSLTAALVLWLALSSFAAHPNYIAYFNEAAPVPHYNLLVDSNLDWGQGLKQLRAYLAASGIDRVKLSDFGPADPAAYDIDYDPLPRWPPPPRMDMDFVPANPAPGVYAIGASNLQGILLDDPSTFDWFRRRHPDAIVGQSILVYHIAADPDPPQAVGLCREPWTPIDDEDVDALFGRQGLRVVRFDCASAGWWPSDSVWYVVPPDVDLRSVGSVEYERRRGDDSLVYRVVRGQGPAEADTWLAVPARFDGGLTLLGFNGLGERRAGQAIEVESVWRVDAPPSPPVSIFAHLLDPQAAFVTGADGFGVPAELLRPGDVIVQRHRFPVPLSASEGEYTIEFGFYRLDTLERYSAIVDGHPIDRVLAQPISVTK